MHYPPTLLYPFLKLGAKLYGHFDLDESSAYLACKDTKIPILLFHGENDSFVPHEMSISLSRLSPLITLVSLPHAEHGLCYMTDAKRYHDSVVNFIQPLA